jgi:hypothetical protein
MMECSSNLRDRFQLQLHTWSEASSVKRWRAQAPLATINSCAVLILRIVATWANVPVWPVDHSLSTEIRLASPVSFRRGVPATRSAVSILLALYTLGFVPWRPLATRVANSCKQMTRARHVLLSIRQAHCFRHFVNAPRALFGCRGVWLGPGRLGRGPRHGGGGCPEPNAGARRDHVTSPAAAGASPSAGPACGSLWPGQRSRAEQAFSPCAQPLCFPPDISRAPRPCPALGGARAGRLARPLARPSAPGRRGLGILD